MKCIVGTIIITILIILLYSVITCGLCFCIIGRTNPLHKFEIHEDDWDGSKSIVINNTDDKFFFFLLCLIWPLLVLFYWIPIGIYKVFKFLVEFVGWCIAKLFKL